MAETYKYNGQTVTVSATQKTAKPETWEPTIFIGNTRHLLTAFSGYPPKLCPSEAAAIAYGKNAAEWIIDNPTKTKEKLEP